MLFISSFMLLRVASWAFGFVASTRYLFYVSEWGLRWVIRFESELNFLSVFWFANLIYFSIIGAYSRLTGDAGFFISLFDLLVLCLDSVGVVRRLTGTWINCVFPISNDSPWLVLKLSLYLSTILTEIGSSISSFDLLEDLFQQSTRCLTVSIFFLKSLSPSFLREPDLYCDL